MRIWRYMLAGVVLLLLLLSGGLWYVEYVNRTHPAPWPMVQGDAGGGFATRARFSTGAPAVLWSYPLGDQPMTGLWPVIGEDNLIYFGGGKRLIALDANGNLRWTWNSSTSISSIALGRHGEIYLLEGDGLTALDSQGRRVWRAELSGAVPSATMIVGQGGVIYIWADQLYAVSDAGDVKWRKPIHTSTLPVETRDGQIVYTDGEAVYALHPNGELAWSRRVGAGISGLAADDSGQIYVASLSSLLVLDLKGQIRAETAAQPDRFFNVAVGQEIIQRGMTRWSKEAEQIWTQESKGQILLTYLDADESVLLFTFAERNRVWPISKLSPQGEELWRFDAVRPGSLPAIGSDGRICFLGRAATETAWSLVCIGDRQSE